MTRSRPCPPLTWACTERRLAAAAGAGGAWRFSLCWARGAPPSPPLQGRAGCAVPLARGAPAAARAHGCERPAPFPRSATLSGCACVRMRPPKALPLPSVSCRGRHTPWPAVTRALVGPWLRHHATRSFGAGLQARSAATWQPFTACTPLPPRHKTFHCCRLPPYQGCSCRPRAAPAMLQALASKALPGVLVRGASCRDRGLHCAVQCSTRYLPPAAPYRRRSTRGALYSMRLGPMRQAPPR